MKKLLTVLLALVMAVCLINLNNSHTKAEGNDTVTVTFDMQGHGTQVPAQTFESGGCATKPTDPTAKGYTFIGWYTEPGCTNAYDFSTPVTAERTLYAKWASNPFTITAMEDGTTTVTLNKNKQQQSSYTPPDLYFSTNNGVNWNTYSYDNGIQITKGQSVWFRSAANKSLSQDYDNCITITADKKITASGNIMSLVVDSNYDAATTIPGSGCFINLFLHSTNLTSIDGLQLPATTLTNECYRNMFFGCIGLTSIPEGLLPATSLKTECYKSMFQNCAGLSSIPENLLPATTLEKSCYCNMFMNCTNLINIPNLPATETLPETCYIRMFKGCSSLDLKTTQDDTYAIPFRIPTTGSATSGNNSLTDMFNGTKAATVGTPTTDTQYYIAKDTTAPKVSATCASNGSVNVNVAKDSGSQIDAILTGYNGTLSTIKLDGTKDLISGSEYTLLDHSSTANASEKELILSKLLISSLSEGTHTVVLTTSGTPVTYTLNITIQSKPTPTPDPEPTYESCEKVIGPTWHWNESKGICEDVGVVGTATR